MWYRNNRSLGTALAAVLVTTINRVQADDAVLSIGPDEVLPLGLPNAAAPQGVALTEDMAAFGGSNVVRIFVRSRNLAAQPDEWWTFWGELNVATLVTDTEIVPQEFGGLVEMHQETLDQAVLVACDPVANFCGVFDIDVSVPFVPENNPGVLIQGRFANDLFGAKGVGVTQDSVLVAVCSTSESCGDGGMIIHVSLFPVRHHVTHNHVRL